MIFCGAVLWCDWILSLFVLSVPATYYHIAVLCGLGITNDNYHYSLLFALIVYIYMSYIYICIYI